MDPLFRQFWTHLEKVACKRAHRALSEASGRTADRAFRNIVSDRGPQSRETRATPVRAKLQLVKTLRREIAF
eukprot:11183976-Lingulodinium_polyedra.AAC.1